MKVLVLGGTGAMGTHLVQILSENSVETVVTSRKNRTSQKNIRYIKGDAHDWGFIENMGSQRWDVIIDFMVYSTLEFKERVDLLLNATAQYIFFSSARVYADSDQNITEKSSRLLDVSLDKEFLSTDEYALAKARQEDLLRNSTYKNWTIIRPYITYSKDRIQLGVLEKEEWLYRALHRRTIVFSRDICSKITTMTFGEDVAKGIFVLIGNPKALCEVYHITTTETCRWEEVLAIYLDVIEKHIGCKPKVLLEDLESFLKWKSAKYQVVYDRLFNRSFNNSKMTQFIDVSKFTDPKVGLRRSLEAFLENPEFKELNWKQEALKDRSSKEYTPLNEIEGVKQKLKYFIFRFLIK